MLTLLLLICLASDPSKPVTPTKAPITLRDQRGRVTGTFTPAAGNIALRDARGRLTGTVTVRGTQATVKDARGRVTGTKKK